MRGGDLNPGQLASFALYADGAAHMGSLPNS